MFTGRAHSFGVALIVEEDVFCHPKDIGVVGAVGVMFGADGVAELFEEFLRLLRGGGGFGHCGSLLKVITGCYTVGVDCTSLQSNS